MADRLSCSSIGTHTGGSTIAPANRQNLTGLSVVPFDILGLPEIGFPVGFSTARAELPALPIGAILGGAPYEEDRMLEVVAAYQNVTDWHLERPADPPATGADRRRTRWR